MRPGMEGQDAQRPLLQLQRPGPHPQQQAALGKLPDAADSFVLVAVDGNFTRSQVQALAKYLPQIVQATSR